MGRRGLSAGGEMRKAPARQGCRGARGGSGETGYASLKATVMVILTFTGFPLSVAGL